MNALHLSHLTFLSIKAAIAAGEKVIEIYNGDYTTTYKTDLSPLTTADIKAHETILDFLKETDIPVLSEEGRNIPWDERRRWHYFWLVDPLDGTREFINRNGEFTINIALVAGQSPVMGVIYVPVTGMLYFGNPEIGAWRTDISTSQQIHDYKSLALLIEQCNCLPLQVNNPTITILASRSHLSPETSEIIEKIKEKYPDCQITNVGSSLKFCRMAEGNAQYYPRFGPTMEWDTAAGHAIASLAGISVKSWPELLPLEYNKENLVNPWFIAYKEGLPDFS
ncbi:MAG: 3'(2'),5'-bisphosphate nucleotidase CysQ [Lentimicrobium sp.]